MAIEGSQSVKPIETMLAKRVAEMKEKLQLCYC
jgi:hypothetical protein